MAMVGNDYENQGMALKLKEHDDALQRYETFEYPCEAHLTKCGSGKTIASILGVVTCSTPAAYRVIILDREEKLSTELRRPCQPTLCQECTQIAIDERISREIIKIGKADQMEQDFAKQMLAEGRT